MNSSKEFKLLIWLTLISGKISWLQFLFEEIKEFPQKYGRNGITGKEMWSYRYNIIFIFSLEVDKAKSDCFTCRWCNDPISTISQVLWINFWIVWWAKFTKITIENGSTLKYYISKIGAKNTNIINRLAIENGGLILNFK